MIIAGEECSLVIFKSAVFERLANLVNGVDDKMLVMNRRENFSGYLVSFEEMMEVSASVILTTFTAAIIHERCKIFAIFGIFDIDATILGIQRAVSGHASRADTVKSITAKFNTNK